MSVNQIQQNLYPFSSLTGSCTLCAAVHISHLTLLTKVNDIKLLWRGESKHICREHSNESQCFFLRRLQRLVLHWKSTWTHKKTSLSPACLHISPDRFNSFQYIHHNPCRVACCQCLNSSCLLWKWSIEWISSI